MDHPSYQYKLHNPVDLSNLASQIGEYCRENDIQSIACSGVSGIVPASVASAMFDLNLIIVRKTSDKKHWYGDIQGPSRPLGRWIIVDDLIDSGATIKHIKDNVTPRERGEFVAILLYNPWEKPEHHSICEGAMVIHLKG